MGIPRRFEGIVAWPAVGVHGAARLDGLFHESHQAVRGCVQNSFHADPPDTRPVLLSRYHDQRFAFGLSAPNSLLKAAQIGFIHFHPSRQPITPRPNHRSPELVQPRPGSLVTAQSKDPLQAQGTGSVLLARQPIHGPEQLHQRLPRVLKDRARGHRRLMVTTLALHQRRAHRPKAPATTPRAAKAFRPSKLVQIIAACLLGIKTKSRTRSDFAGIPPRPAILPVGVT